MYCSALTSKVCVGWIRIPGCRAGGQCSPHTPRGVGRPALVGVGVACRNSPVIRTRARAVIPSKNQLRYHCLERLLPVLHRQFVRVLCRMFQLLCRAQDSLWLYL